MFQHDGYDPSDDRYEVWTDGALYAVWDRWLGRRQTAKQTDGALMRSLVTQLNLQARIREECKRDRARTVAGVPLDDDSLPVDNLFISGAGRHERGAA